MEDHGAALVISPSSEAAINARVALARMGYTVILSADTPDEARPIVGQHQPGIVILDVSVPGVLETGESFIKTYLPASARVIVFGTDSFPVPWSKRQIMVIEPQPLEFIRVLADLNSGG